MLQDSALKFDRDQAYGISQKPFENGQYKNKNGLLAAILKISENSYYVNRGHML